MKAFLTAWLCLTTFLWAGSKPKSPDTTLIFTNVNVIGVRDGGLAQGATVVIKNGRIIGLGKVGFIPQERNIQIAQ